MTDDADLSSSGGDAGPSTSRNRHAVHDPDQDPLSPPIPPGARRLSGTGARRPRPKPRAAPGTTGVGIGIWDIIVWPVGMLFSIVGGVWYFIGEYNFIAYVIWIGGSLTYFLKYGRLFHSLFFLISPLFSFLLHLHLLPSRVHLRIPPQNTSPSSSRSVRSPVSHNRSSLKSMSALTESSLHTSERNFWWVLLCW